MAEIAPRFGQKMNHHTNDGIKSHLQIWAKNSAFIQSSAYLHFVEFMRFPLHDSRVYGTRCAEHSFLQGFEPRSCVSRHAKRHLTTGCRLTAGETIT